MNKWAKEIKLTKKAVSPPAGAESAGLVPEAAIR